MGATNAVKNKLSFLFADTKREVVLEAVEENLIPESVKMFHPLFFENLSEEVSKDLISVRDYFGGDKIKTFLNFDIINGPNDTGSYQGISILLGKSKQLSMALINCDSSTIILVKHMRNLESLKLKNIKQYFASWFDGKKNSFAVEDFENQNLNTMWNEEIGKNGFIGLYKTANVIARFLKKEDNPFHDIYSNSEKYSENSYSIILRCSLEQLDLVYHEYWEKVLETTSMSLGEYLESEPRKKRRLLNLQNAQRLLLTFISLVSMSCKSEVSTENQTEMITNHNSSMSKKMIREEDIDMIFYPNSLNKFNDSVIINFATAPIFKKDNTESVLLYCESFGFFEVNESPIESKRLQKPYSIGNPIIPNISYYNTSPIGLTSNSYLGLYLKILDDTLNGKTESMNYISDVITTLLINHKKELLETQKKVSIIFHKPIWINN
jgi:hypothetical protein